MFQRVRLPRMRSHTFVHTYSHRPPITCHGFSPGPANHRSRASHDNGHERSVHPIWILDHRRRDVDAHFGHTEHRGCTTIHQFSQNGSTCACKKVLKAKVDESKGILLPMHAFIPLSKPDEHPRVCCGAPTGGLWPKYPRLLLRIS